MTADQYCVLANALAKAEADGENPSAILAIRLLALTGCRRGEIERLQWHEVDLAGRCLRLSDSKEGKGIRPLGGAAAQLLTNVSRDGRYVLRGKTPDNPYVGLPKAWPRVVLRDELPELTPHGLRHAFASVAADLGFAELTIAALLGHGTHTITGRYLHHLDSSLLAAADDVSCEIAAMMAGRRTPAKIVPLRAVVRKTSYVP